MRRSLVLVVVALSGAACGDLKSAGSGDAGPATGDGGVAIGVPVGGGALQVTVDSLVGARNRPGARSPAGYRPWRTGIAVSGDRVYWVESGTAPGVYVAPTAGCADGSCVEKVTDAVRPASFAATPSDLYFADTTILKRVALGSNAVTTVASAPEEVVNLAATDDSVFWTFDTDQAIRRTAPGGGGTGAVARSNGTPVSFGLAGDRLYWAGVDISGLTVAIQSVALDGTGAKEVTRYAAGFHCMTGNGTFLYYAEGNPTNVHRLTASSGRDEIVAREALGVTDIALDDRFAYWTEPGNGDFGNGRVRRIGHDATEAQSVAVSIAHPVALAVRGSAVFVASGGTQDKAFADGAIVRLTIGESRSCPVEWAPRALGSLCGLDARRAA